MSGPIVCVDVDTIAVVLSPLRYEMGLREMVLVDCAVEGKIGIGRNTCTLVVRLTPDDLYEFSIESRRRHQGKVRRNVLRYATGIDVSQLYSTIVDHWCSLCDERCW